MPVRSLSARSFFDPEFVCPGCLVEGTLPWLLARHRSQWFPEWLFLQWRGHRRLGRDAWPAVVLMTLLLLRSSETGMSRRAAARRAVTDVAWRAAMGLSLRGATPSEKTLRDFERFLLHRQGATGVPRYLLLHEHWVRMCLDAGVGGTKKPAWAMDSTPMWCYGATRDTVRLLGDGLRMLAADWARSTRRPLGAVAQDWHMPFLEAKSTKGAFPIDWSQPQTVAQVVTRLASSVVKAVRHVWRGLASVRSGLRRALLRRCRHLLRVLRDDLAPDAAGHLVIAEHVAADRLVSITDPQARHGRKSKSRSFNGFKVHLLGDVVSGLILSIAVTPGNVHDSMPAHHLIRRAKNLCDQIERVLADTAYGGARLRYVLQRASGVTLVAPPQPVASKEGIVGKGDVVLDLQARKATCANGVPAERMAFVWSGEHGVHVPHIQWPKAACDRCPLSGRCRGKERGGHRLRLHPYEAQLRAARQTWRDPDTRALYRVRTQCERLVNLITSHGGRQAHAFGLAQAQLQAHAIAAASNLRLLAGALATASSAS